MGWDDALGTLEESADPVEVAKTTRRPHTGGRRYSNAHHTPRQRRRDRRMRQRKRDNKRRDIQGLRAVAVLAVVANHLFTHPQGGFLGVDVFFVISGYLITSLLLREGNRRGTISLIGFYKRRIRRLLPAALTVTVATVLAAHFVFIGGRFKSTLTDGIWATLFGANWRQINLGTNYFKSYGPVSPLQHYWSLSVEEQFYFVWPLVLMASFLICRRLFDGRAQAIVATGTLGALLLTVPSLLYAWHESSVNEVIVYFSTFSRAWELGLGATLAVLQPYMRGNRLVLSTLSFFGLAIICVSYFTVAPHHIPFPGAILPCLATGMCLIAWTAKTRANNPVLTNPVANYIGDISYSIYLVHFPVIIFAAALLTDRSVAYYIAVCLFVLGAAALLFHGIENPIRESNWLKPKAQKQQKRDRAPLLSPGLALGAMATLGALLVYTVVVPQHRSGNPYERLLLQNQTASASAGAATGPSGAPAPGLLPIGPGVSVVQADLKQAVLTTSWPKIDPPFDQPAAENNNGCQAATLPLLPIAKCTWGSSTAAHTMVLVGDSTSGAYTNTFDHFIDQVPGWKMIVRNTTSCPFSDSGFIETNAATHSQGCADRNDAILAELQQTKPDLVVETSNNGEAAPVDGITNELAKLKGYVKSIVVLAAPPKIDDPLQCVTVLSRPTDCVTKMNSTYNSWIDNEAGMASKVGGTFINPTLLFCVDKLCPLFVKTIPLTKDGSHLTSTYATYLAPAMHELFQEAKVLP